MDKKINGNVPSPPLPPAIKTDAGLKNGEKVSQVKGKNEIEKGKNLSLAEALAIKKENY